MSVKQRLPVSSGSCGTVEDMSFSKFIDGDSKYQNQYALYQQSSYQTKRKLRWKIIRV